MPASSHRPPRTPDLGYLLNRATRQLRLGLADALADTGLTPQQAAVLMAIGRSAERSLTPRDIAASIDTDQATTSGLLDRLSRDGWLLARPNPHDGRSRLIALRPKAEDALPRVLAAAGSVSEAATASLSASEVATLSELLVRLCSADADADAPGEAVDR